jgi:hypothetical protein
MDMTGFLITILAVCFAAVSGAMALGMTLGMVESGMVSEMVPSAVDMHAAGESLLDVFMNMRVPLLDEFATGGMPSLEAFVSLEMSLDMFMLMEVLELEVFVVVDGSVSDVLVLAGYSEGMDAVVSWGDEVDVL